MAKLTNQDFIEKYKLDNIIIANKYSDGNDELVEGIALPLKIDNRQTFSPIDFQKDTPHCAGFAAANLCESVIWKKTGKIVQLDAHQIYAKAKELDGSIDMEGTYPECTLKAAVNLGVFGEHVFEVKTIRNTGSALMVPIIKRYIHQHDFLLAGFKISENWYKCSKKNHIIGKASGKFLGGHAVCIVGYDKTGVYIANSWSPAWGAKGFAIVSWDAFRSDFMYAAYLVQKN